MPSKTYRKRKVGCGRRRQRGRGTLSGYNALHDPIHLMNYLSRQQGGRRRLQRGRGTGPGPASLQRRVFKRDEYGRLLFKDPRHV